MGLKILSGIFKNHSLVSPKGSKTRPTSSRLRGSVFNILQGHVEGADFLDIFAGSGAMGLEALSRGAASVTFIEKNVKAVQCIRSNLKTLGIKGKVMLIDAFLGVKILKNRFDIIYLDPPYDLDIGPILELLPPILKKGGCVLLEQSSKTDVKTTFLKVNEKRIYGDSTLYLFSQNF